MEVEAVDREIARSVVTAALRAAVAWTRRETEPRAWRELSRMTGVVSYALGPGRGPAGPMELVESLHRPMSELVPAAATMGELNGLVLLDERGRLTDAAIEVACDYTEALFAEVDDPGERWLPPWAWAARRAGAAEGLRGPDQLRQRRGLHG